MSPNHSRGPAAPAAGPSRVGVAARVVVAAVVLLSLLGTVPAGAAGEPVDVVFVVDRSNSMTDDWSELRGELVRIQGRLDESGVDVRYALLTYGETVETEQGWTDDFGEVDTAFDVSTAGHREHASEAILAATSMDFRADAARVVVLVTDEDDDSAGGVRSDAVDALSGFHFVAISPGTPATSSCALHDPPCDDDGSNELRDVAGDAGGDWIDVSDGAADVVEQAAGVIATSASGSAPASSNGGSAEAAAGPSFSWSASTADLTVRNLSANRTTVEIGEPVAFTAAVENADWRNGEFEMVLSGEDGTVVSDATSVPAGQSRTATLVHAFEEPGEYRMTVGSEALAVDVTPPRPTTVETSLGADGRGLTATVVDARANTSVTIPTSNATWLDGAPVAIESVRLTPTRDADFELRVDAMDAPPNGTVPLPADVRPVGYLVANSSLSDGDVRDVTIEYTAEPEATHVYHYDEGAGEWVRLDRTALNGSTAHHRLAASSTGLSVFALAVHEPSFVVTDLAVDDAEPTVGETVETTVTVENRGRVDGTYDARLSVDGEVVTASRVAVPANGSRAVTLAYTPGSPGEYTLAVGDGVEGTIAVAAAAGAAETGSSATTAGSTATPGTSSTDGQPGFGVGLALLALLGLALLAGRRR